LCVGVCVCTCPHVSATVDLYVPDTKIRPPKHYTTIDKDIKLSKF